MVELSAVSKDYGKFRAVSGVSLSIQPGQVTGLLGPNGAGKSTIIRMITCLLAPTEGSVSVCGFDTVTESAKARASIGYLPEFAPLYPEMTARGYLKFRAGLAGLRGKEAGVAVEGALQRCWLADVAEKRISAMSKGYKQRVGLAGAILHDPKVLILDEPTTGLDPTQIRETRALLKSLAVGRVLLLSSHILPEVEATCDRIVIIARGVVRANGTPADLLRASAQPGYLVQPGRLTTPEQLQLLAVGIAGLKGVAGVNVDATLGANGLRVVANEGGEGEGDLREPIAVLAAQQGVLLTELHMLRPTLEQVFMRVVQEGAGEEAADGGQGVAAA